MLAAKIRALDPTPGALTRLDGETIKIFKAQAQPLRQPEALKTLVPGQIIEVDKQAIRVVCGEGTLSLTALQRPGARRLEVREFLNGKRVVAGQSFLPYSE
jgi:methionyl-tRNA formyltransferase